MLLIFFFMLLVGSSIGTIPLNDFFPFGSEIGDSIMGTYNTSEGPFRLPYTFPYFDNIYNEISIIYNGLFSFLPSSNSYYFSNPRPFDTLNESSVIAGFWHYNIFNIDNNDTNIVYYQIHSNISQSNYTMKVFNKTTDYVRNFFPEQRPFKPKMVIIGTWYYITIGNNATGEFNNTFQIVLSTDEDRSFVFFLYHDLQWANPYNSTNPYYIAQAGFYNGYRNISETLPYSKSEDVVKLANESNVNVPGLFAFRVDADQLNAGGCNENLSTISFRPRVSSQLGSTALSVYGPCFTNQTKIKCQFSSSSQSVTGIVIDTFRAICLTSFASIHESVSVKISIDDGRTFVSAGNLTYLPVQFGSDEIIIETEDGDKLLHIGQYIKLKWYFSEVIKNAFPNGTKIDIELWKVSLNHPSELQNDNQLTILQRNLDLIDSVRIQLPSSISNIQTCFIRIVAHFNSQTYAGLNTGLLVVRSQSSIASESCLNWAAQQPEPDTWNRDGLLQCPMTRQQAIAAGRCCYEPDRQCQRNNPNPNNCWFHQARSGYDEPSAVECYLSITKNRYGARAECCYDNDTMLISRGTGAGTDDRYASSTSPVQHFFHDTLPYLKCCMMSSNVEACNKYMYYRPSRRGSNTMGETGRMWGDPHFETLDGTSYTFNGYGEYIYLAISNNTSLTSAFDSNNQSYIFMSQIRTIPLTTSNATITRGFSARSYDTRAESISLTISRREYIILRRENATVEFEDNIDTLYFPELTITRLDGNNNRHFSFSWTIGVTIEINVIEMTSPSRQLVLNIGASVAGSFRGKTYGLLGTYDGTENNDLRSKNGTVVSSNATLQEIHNDFGMTWAINPSSSLFYYESNQSAQFFYGKNLEFIPSFNDPTNTTNISIIHETCKINATLPSSSWNIAQRTCYYDLFMTNDVTFAKTSLDAGNKVLSDRENGKNPPLFNLLLPNKMNFNESDSVNLTISASSEYPSHVVQLSAVHLPKSAIFNQSSGIFKWTAIKGEHYLSIAARDTAYNLRSKHDIIFYVKGLNNGCNRLFYQTNFIILIFAMIMISWQ